MPAVDGTDALGYDTLMTKERRIESDAWALQLMLAFARRTSLVRLGMWVGDQSGLGGWISWKLKGGCAGQAVHWWEKDRIGGRVAREEGERA